MRKGDTEIADDVFTVVFSSKLRKVELIAANLMDILVE